MFLLKDMEPHVAWELSLTQLSVFPKERAESCLQEQVQEPAVASSPQVLSSLITSIKEPRS